MKKPDTNIDTHKDWYFTSVCFKKQNPVEDELGLRWARFVTFAKDKASAKELAHREACRIKFPEEHILDINLYKNNYKKDARTLVHNNYYIY